jgi:predicted TIM-barrel fold metal-dependent hydrolase
MFDGIRVIDADGHVMEPNELYDRYIDPQFRSDLDELKRLAATRASHYFFGYFHQLNTGRPLGVARVDEPLMRAARRPRPERPNPRGGMDPHVRIVDMDREGIDVAVLFATIVSSFCALKSVDFEVAMIRAYHRWIADYCAAYPHRLKAVAVVPMRAPERAAEEIHHAANEPWCVGIYLSSHIEDMLLDHPALHPIWRACVEEDLPVCFHGGTARPPYGIGTFEMGNNLFIQHSATNPFEVMRGIASFIGGGGRRGMAAVLDGAARRALRADAGVRAESEAQAVGGDPFRQFFHLMRSRRGDAAVRRRVRGRRPDSVRLGLPAFRRPLPPHGQVHGGAQGIHIGGAREDSGRQPAPPLHAAALTQPRPPRVTLTAKAWGTYSCLRESRT